jgi:hypothetical protein
MLDVDHTANCDSVLAKSVRKMQATPVHATVQPCRPSYSHVVMEGETRKRARSAQFQNSSRNTYRALGNTSNKDNLKQQLDWGLDHRLQAE